MGMSEYLVPGTLHLQLQVQAALLLLSSNSDVKESYPCSLYKHKYAAYS